MKTFKRLVSYFLVLTMILALSGCSSNTWSVKTESNSLPAGVYIYYLSAAYSEAYSKAEDTNNVLSGKIGDKDATQWVKDEALNSCKKLIAIEYKFDEMKLSLTEDELTSADETTESQWGQYQKVYEGYGVSRESFHRATSLFFAKYEKVFNAIYGKEGAKNVSDDEIKKYYLENYTNYSYFAQVLTEQDQSGNTVLISEDKIKKIEDKFKDYVKKINDGSSFKDVVEQYKKDFSLEGEQSITSNEILKENTNMPEEINKKITDLKVGKADYIKSNNAYYLLYKGDINSTVDDLKKEQQKENVRLTMKSKEFSKDIEDVIKKTEFEVNNSVVKKYKPSMFESK